VEERAKNLELESPESSMGKRAKLQEDARKQALEEQLLPRADKDKLINDLKTQIESLKQKAEQGSQQSQGEVMECNWRDARQAFNPMRFFPCRRTRGADLLHHVHSPLGQKCGIIIWESKRTKTCRHRGSQAQG